MATAAAGGLSDPVPTRITQLLSHWNTCRDHVTLCVCVCVRAQLPVSDNAGRDVLKGHR